MRNERRSGAVTSGLPTWEAWLDAEGVPPLEAAGGGLFHNAHVAITAALAGQGFALGLSPLADDDLAAGRLVRPFARDMPSPFGFWFVCRQDRMAEPKIIAFREWVMAAR